MRIINRFISYLANRYAKKIIKNYYGITIAKIESSLELIDLSEEILVKSPGFEHVANNISYDVCYFKVSSANQDLTHLPYDYKYLMDKLTSQNDTRVLFYKIPLIDKLYVFIFRPR